LPGAWRTAVWTLRRTHRSDVRRLKFQLSEWRA
jgi:hypothetical protein